MHAVKRTETELVNKRRKKWERKKQQNKWDSTSEGFQKINMKQSDFVVSRGDKDLVVWQEEKS